MSAFEYPDDVIVGQYGQSALVRFLQRLGVLVVHIVDTEVALHPADVVQIDHVLLDRINCFRVTVESGSVRKGDVDLVGIIGGEPSRIGGGDQFQHVEHLQLLADTLQPPPGNCQGGFRLDALASLQVGLAGLLVVISGHGITPRSEVTTFTSSLPSFFRESR